MSFDEDFQGHLDRLTAGALQPGAVVGLQRGDSLRLFASGHMEVGRRRPMRHDAIFRISSMSKPIVAIALLQLIEDGRLRLEDRVAEWLPELASPRVLTSFDAPLDRTVPADNAITVEHLLSSRMGAGILAMPPDATPIQREIARLGLPGFGPDDPANPVGQDEWMRCVGALPLMAQPGSEWFYNISTLVQGILVSRVAGRPLSGQIAERITGPLGMSDTGFIVPAGKLDRLTSAYAADMTETDDAGFSAWSKQQNFEVSMVSTAKDYAAFARMLHRRGEGPGGALIGEELLRRMMSDHLTPGQRQAGAAFLDGRGWGYGLSVDASARIGDRWIGDVGWAGGLGTSWTSRLADDAAIIVLGCRAIDHPDVYAAHIELTGLALD